jgi:hypothetical protein
MRKLRHNPIIGYHAIDKTGTVMGPPGTLLSPAFATAEKAREAVQQYGLDADFLMTTDLHLGGVLGVVLDDVGDIQLDGESAQRFVYACQRNGIPLNQKSIKHIKLKEPEPKYSCRKMLTV